MARPAKVQAQIGSVTAPERMVYPLVMPPVGHAKGSEGNSQFESAVLIESIQRIASNCPSV